MHPAILDALAVLFPVDCAGCGRPDRAVCEQCLAGLGGALIRSRTPAGFAVTSALRYDGTARRLLLALKEQGRRDVAKHLARHLAPLIEAALAPGTRLVPVPASPAALRRRGFDPVTLLAGRRGFRALAVARSGTPQKGLGLAGRAGNRVGYLRARCSLQGLRLVIVDDILTTGATLDEAARAIREAGGEVVEAVTVAATPRYFESFIRPGLALPLSLKPARDLLPPAD